MATVRLRDCHEFALPYIAPLTARPPAMSAAPPRSPAPSFAEEQLLFSPATPQTDAVPLIFAFPNQYSVGITSLGYQMVWAWLAQRSDLQVSRLFLDLRDRKSVV